MDLTENENKQPKFIFCQMCDILVPSDSRVELKRLCEIFTRMFADPHSKVRP